jgi:hypothetical protein
MTGWGCADHAEDSGVIRVLESATERAEVKRIGMKSNHNEIGSVIDGMRDCPNRQRLEQPLVTDL